MTLNTHLIHSWSHLLLCLLEFVIQQNSQLKFTNLPTPFVSPLRSLSRIELRLVSMGTENSDTGSRFLPTHNLKAIICFFSLGPNKKTEEEECNPESSNKKGRRQNYEWEALCNQLDECGPRRILASCLKNIICLDFSSGKINWRSSRV